MKKFKPSDLGIIGVQHFSQGVGTHTLIPRMVADARNKGWRFVTLDECLGVTELQPSAVSVDNSNARGALKRPNKY